MPNARARLDPVHDLSPTEDPGTLPRRVPFPLPPLKTKRKAGEGAADIKVIVIDKECGAMPDSPGAALNRALLNLDQLRRPGNKLDGLRVAPPIHD